MHLLFGCYLIRKLSRVLAVAIMTCVFRLLGVKHGQDHLDTKLLMNGGLGIPMAKLLGTYKFPSYLI